MHLRSNNGTSTMNNASLHMVIAKSREVFLWSEGVQPNLQDALAGLEFGVTCEQLNESSSHSA
jgi:hypothetical protein